jgi:hypothetical protein
MPKFVPMLLVIKKDPLNIVKIFYLLEDFWNITYFELCF